MNKRPICSFILFARICLAISLLFFTTGVVKADSAIEQQQRKTITGKVLDNNGEAVIGASVFVKGTTIGTATNLDGVFTLNNVSEGETITVSYIGLNSREFAVSSQNEYNVTLQEDSKLLEEVVVVGYGVQKKINLTGSVSTVTADKLSSRATPNLTAALAGLAPGVRVTQGSGNPGSESVSIQIRGIGSINASAPMILVDGVVADMTVINPDDVESISFLKDAASAAIYGSRAANGVVLVTTKKGTKETPRVTFSSMLAREQAVTSMNFLSDMPLWMKLHNEGQRNNSPTSVNFWYPDETIADWERANANPNGIYTDPVTGNTIPNWLAYPNTDWAREMFKPTLYHRHSLSISGGSETSTYLLSGSFQENPGTLENTSLSRFNIRANVESRIKDFLTIGTQTYATKEFKDPGSTSMTYLQQVYPGMNPKYQGLYGAAEDPNMPNMNNILQSIAHNGGQNEYTRINTSWYANADLWKGISAEARFNYNEYQRQDENYSQDIPRYRFREGTNRPVENIGVLENATSYRYSYFSTAYTANLILRYMRSFGNHDISAFAAYEQYYSKNTGFNATKKGLLDWNVTDITSTTNMESISGPTDSNGRTVGKQTLAILSYFGRLNYAYKNKYLFEANLRTDGSSRFAPNHRWGTFSAFSAGWRVSEESFFEPLKGAIDNLKLKASYGELGNQVSGYYDWQSIYSKVNAVFDQSVQVGVVPSRLPNFLMSWEKTATTNIGFEANFLKQRLALEADYFYQNTTDMLVSPPQYNTVGVVSTPQINAAALQNQGFDVIVSWQDRIRNFRYYVSANIGYSTNKITKYNGQLKYELDPNVLDIWGNPTWRYTNLADVSTGGDNRVLEGHMYNEFFLRKPYQGTGTYYLSDGNVDPNGGPKDGMIRTRADLDWVRAMIDAGYSFNNNRVGPNAANLWYGEILMADVNGDGKYGNTDDREFIGKSPLPKWTFGMNMTGEWKGVDLSLHWAGRFGSYHYINQRGANASTFAQNTDALPANSLNMFYSYDAVAAWANNGNNDYDPAKDPNANFMGMYPRLLNANSTMVPSSFYLYNTSFLKLKSLQVGYSLPKQWLNRTKVGNLRLFASGENLLTFKSKDFPSVDPELGGSVIIYPIAQMFSGGISVTF